MTVYFSPAMIVSDTRLPPLRELRVAARCKSCNREYTAQEFSDFDAVMRAEKCSCGGGILIVV